MSHDPSAGDLGRLALSESPEVTAMRVAEWCTDAAEVAQVARFYRDLGVTLAEISAVIAEAHDAHQ